MGGFRIEPIGPISGWQTRIHFRFDPKTNHLTKGTTTMKIISSTIAAALIASASFAGAAFANEGDYYQGAQKASTQVDHMSTGSIAKDQQNASTAPAASVNRGDYYEGANRPN
jgi:hypothetical protein